MCLKDDNKISTSEIKDALRLVNERMGSKYSINEDCVNFIKNIDTNGDNEIDLEEFKRAFLISDENVDESLDSDLSDDEDVVQIVRL